MRRAYPDLIAHDINRPNLPLLIRRFIARTLTPGHASNSDSNTSDLSESALPIFASKISVYHSAVAHFYAPSDICGTKGMRRERIHAAPSWRKGAPRYDTIFVQTHPDEEGMLGIDVAQVRIFFAFKYHGTDYHCALVDWFTRVDDQPDADTGMWVVERDYDLNHQQISEVVHIDAIMRCSHLIGVYGPEPVGTHIKFSDSLYTFHTYYVNKYADHHSFEVAV